MMISLATRQRTDYCRKQAWVLKNSLKRASFCFRGLPLRVFFLSSLGRGGQSRVCGSTEEADQSLDVLCSRRQEELLPNKP
jgi:hypothetical protein